MSDALYLIQVIIILIPSSMAARNILQSPVASPHHVTSTKTTTSFPSAATANSQVRWPIRTCFSFAKKENSRAPSSTPPRSSSGEVKPLSGVHYDTTESIKGALYKAVEGIDRGIFGATSEKKSEVEGLVELLESQNPNPCPTDHLTQVDGCWKLVYSTISILGSKRTKLGLRYLVTLGDFLQTIDVAQGKATNEIKFNVGGLKMFSGQLTIVASYTIATKTRVDIKFENSDISPSQLMDLFRKNHDLLLAIFNPDGWLEITYVDESFRIGRDDKGNIFILERFIQAR